MKRFLNRRQWLQGSAAAAVAASSLSRSRGAVEAAVKGRWERAPFGAARRPDLIPLHYNENPYGPSPAARTAIQESLGQACRYTFPEMPLLARKLAARHAVSAEHVLLGNGSREVLSMAAAAIFRDGGEVVSPHPTFSVLPDYAARAGGSVHHVPLDHALQNDLNEMDRRITSTTKMVYVCNPNNPSGGVVDPDRLRDFCRSNSRRVLIFVDEAYIELTDTPNRHSMLDLVREGLNVVVSRTFSKLYGMAGLRVGYGIMRPDLADRFSNYQMSSNNVAALQAAMASLDDTEFEAFSRERIQEGRSLICRLCDEAGYSYVPSQTNFVFYRTGRPIADYRERMKEEGVLVGRPFPPYLNWCRVSVGTRSDMEIFSRAFARVAS